MIKYSLVALAAAAVLFSVGCDDSECCGTGVDAPVVGANVAPVISRVLGQTHNSTVDCVPGNTRTLATTSSDSNGNLDTSSYSWMVDGVANTTGTVDCPADGETKRVCVTVKDDDGLTSNEACITLRGQAEQASCPTPVITAKSATVDGAEVNAMVKSTKYYLSYQEELDNCPTPKTCNWTVRSLDGNVEKVDNCFDFAPGGSDHGEQSGTYEGTWIQLCMESAADPYNNIEVNLTCTGMDTVSRTFDVTP